MSFPFYTLLLVSNKMPLTPSGMIKNPFKPTIYSSCQHVSTKQCCSELRPAGSVGIQKKLDCSSLKKFTSNYPWFCCLKKILELYSLSKVCYHILPPSHPLFYLPVGFSLGKYDKQFGESIPLSLISVYG